MTVTKTMDVFDVDGLSEQARERAIESERRFRVETGLVDDDLMLRMGDWLLDLGLDGLKVEAYDVYNPRAFQLSGTFPLTELEQAEIVLAGLPPLASVTVHATPDREWVNDYYRFRIAFPYGWDELDDGFDGDALAAVLDGVMKRLDSFEYEAGKYASEWYDDEIDDEHMRDYLRDADAWFDVDGERVNVDCDWEPVAA